MKGQLSWFILFVARIVAADELGPDFIPDCKYVVEAETESDVKSVSGIYTYWQPIKMKVGHPMMALARKIPVPGKKYYNFDDNSFDRIRIKWSKHEGNWALRFMTHDSGHKNLTVQASEHFCLRRDSDPHPSWTIFNESLNKIVGWSKLTDEITGTTCNPDMGQVNYIPPTEDDVDNLPFELPTYKLFRMAYECVTFLKKLELSSDIVSKSTAASLDVIRGVCKYWNQPQNSLLLERNGSESACFLEENESLTATPVLEDILSDAFSGCVLVVFGSEDYRGPYLPDITSPRMTQRGLEYVFGFPEFGPELSYDITYSAAEGRMTFNGANMYFEVDEFPCNPENTDDGPFDVLNSDSTPTGNVAIVYSVTGPLELRCGRRGDHGGNDLGCSSGVTYMCSFGLWDIREIQQCINKRLV